MKKTEKGARNMYTITTSITKNFTRLHNQVKVLCCSSVGNGICGEKKVNVLCKFVSDLTRNKDKMIKFRN
jgi:hypothetical protein